MRFLGLGLQDKVPDAQTIRAFRERLTKAKAIDALFAHFDPALRDTGHTTMSGAGRGQHINRGPEAAQYGR